MENTMELFTGLDTVLDSNLLLRFSDSNQKAYLRIKNQFFDEEVLVYDRENKVIYLQNEIHDIINTYYQSYYEMMEQALCSWDKMDFMDLALGVATGMRIYNMYAPAFLELRKIMNLHYHKGEATIPFGWSVGQVKYADKFRFVCELAEDQYGKMVYTYDDYNFPQEVFDILMDELKCIEPYPEKVVYSNWKTNAWVFKTN